MATLKRKADPAFADPIRVPVFTLRFLLVLLLMIGGLAWITYYYVGVRADVLGGDTSGPAFMGKLENWNYLIGFGAFFLGLMISANPKTPLGRGRGVVVGMLGCFLLGLLWICTFYVFSNDLSPVPVMNDLGQKNLIVGIALMATGFVFATRWE